MNVEDDQADPVELRPNARRFGVSTVPIDPYAGAAEGIAIPDEPGYEAIESTAERLTDRLKHGLGDDRLLSPREFESGLVTVSVDTQRERSSNSWMGEDGSDRVRPSTPPRPFTVQRRG